MATAQKSNIKLLLMGKAGAGKTSMHSIIFANLPACDTSCIPWTKDVEESKIKFLGMGISINDCGGQDNLFDHYFNKLPDRIFSNVKVLIYVFDVMHMSTESIEQYEKTLSFLIKYSPTAKVFVLIHKMDLAQDRQKKFAIAKNTIMSCSGAEHVLECFPTTIWDPTLYQAWATMVQTVVPDLGVLTESLERFGSIIECDEIILFEKSTFLIIGNKKSPFPVNIKKSQLVTDS
jgi:Ras-related GTP-binding protein A/B